MKKMNKPSATKTSAQRRELALRKRFHTSFNVITDDALHLIFKYLSLSDLLRCACVSRGWKQAASAPSLWKNIFNRLPSKIRSLSVNAKTTGPVDWREECVRCAKKRRQKVIARFNKNVHYSVPLRWLLVFRDTTSNSYEVASSDEFTFNIAFSVRWNEVDVPPMSKLLDVKLYALFPLVFDDVIKPVENSVCTRTLVVEQRLNNNDVSDEQLQRLAPDDDDHVTLFTLRKTLCFGIWSSSLPGERNIAFVVMGYMLSDLVDVLHRSGRPQVQPPKHVAIMNDISTKYGLGGYKAILEMRNSRKSFSYELYGELKAGYFTDSHLVVEYIRDKEYTFFDINDKFIFTWKTLALKGMIKDTVVVDFVLLDCNGEQMMTFSSPVSLVKVCDEKDNYSFENAELWRLEKLHDHCTFVVDLMRNCDTNESTVAMIQIQLSKLFVNEWFGTSY